MCIPLDKGVRKKKKYKNKEGKHLSVNRILKEKIIQLKKRGNSPYMTQNMLLKQG